MCILLTVSGLGIRLKGGFPQGERLQSKDAKRDFFLGHFFRLNCLGRNFGRKKVHARRISRVDIIKRDNNKEKKRQQLITNDLERTNSPRLQQP